MAPLLIVPLMYPLSICDRDDQYLILGAAGVLAQDAPPPAGTTICLPGLTRLRGVAAGQLVFVLIFLLGRSAGIRENKLISKQPLRMFERIAYL